MSKDREKGYAMKECFFSAEDFGRQVRVCVAKRLMAKTSTESVTLGGASIKIRARDRRVVLVHEKKVDGENWPTDGPLFQTKPFPRHVFLRGS